MNIFSCGSYSLSGFSPSSYQVYLIIFFFYFVFGFIFRFLDLTEGPMDGAPWECMRSVPSLPSNITVTESGLVHRSQCSGRKGWSEFRTFISFWVTEKRRAKGPSGGVGSRLSKTSPTSWVILPWQSGGSRVVRCPELPPFLELLEPRLHSGQVHFSHISLLIRKDSPEAYMRPIVCQFT